MKHDSTTTQSPGGGPPRLAFGASASVCLWAALVAVGVCGRLWQPTWNVTPMAGIGLAAGAVFSSPFVAASVPLAALALSNLVLPGYGSLAMAAVVSAATAWPVLLGRWLGFAEDRRVGRWISLAGSGLANSVVFFLTTNLAHWWLTHDYPPTFAGLVSCYAAALPFYRWMPVGDVAWTLIVFAGLSAALAVTRASRSTAAA